MITSKVTIRHIARVLGRFSSCLLAVPLDRLHYRALERFKIEALKEHKVYPARIYLLKLNNRNARPRCKIGSKLTIKIPELGT